MANAATEVKVMRRVDRQRIERDDLETAVRLALDGVENNLWSLIADFEFVIHGLHVQAPTGQNFPITAGAAIQHGILLKNGSATSVNLDTNPAGDDRIDVIYANGYTETDSDLANPRVLSAISRNTVTGEAVGTGDGSTKAWDLAQSDVDPSTLKVYVAGTQVGGWNYSKGTGGSGEDQIIFHDAPANPDAITADYVWVDGGVESTATNQPSRKTRTPTLYVAKGTPAASPTPPVLSGGEVILAHVTVPAGWAGGAGPTIDNSVKDFLLTPDNSLDSNYLRAATNPGGIAGAIRGFDQVYGGFRLLYSTNAGKIKVSPGWGVLGGVAYRLDETTEFDLATAGVSGTGWHYLYLAPQPSSGAKPGSIVAVLDAHTSAPTSRGRRPAFQERWYIGAVYIESVGPPIVVRPFYTHGAWTYWESPTEITLADTSGVITDLTVSNYIPKTGCLLRARLHCLAEAGSAGDGVSLFAGSHYNATAKSFPNLNIFNFPVVNPSPVYVESNGILRAEDSSGTRKVNYSRADFATVSNVTAKLTILGYLDDYRAMSDDGASVSFY